MKVQDLRLGNYVQFNDDEDNGGLWLSPTEITGILSHVGEVDISSDKVNNLRLNQRILLERLEPIPLTEEWLKRLGFEWVENKHYCNKKQWTLQVTGLTCENGDINKDETWFDGIGDYSWLPNSTKPKTMVVNTLCKGNYVCNSLIYVHQIQNLYFALTGEELTIKK